MIANVLSISGGKDSTAMLLLALALDTPNLQPVFADTGHEHPATYEYIRYLEFATGIPIRWVRADFSSEIARRRAHIQQHWPGKLKAGVPGEWVWDGPIDESGKPINPISRQAIPYPPAPSDPHRCWIAGRASGQFTWNPGRPALADSEIEETVGAALDVMHPTGIPFLDMCLWKGFFPSTTRRFCTTFLKKLPIEREVIIPALLEHGTVWSWQGVRAQESPARRFLPEFEDAGGYGLFVYRPLIRWSWQDVFEAHRYMGIKPNPLYRQGAGRVGCMPCIHCRKDELSEIAARFPAEVERVRRWERLVSTASLRGSATLLTAVNDPTVSAADYITPGTHGIDRMIEWSRTTRGGRQYDLLATDGEGCSSIYGLCEPYSESRPNLFSHNPNTAVTPN